MPYNHKAIPLRPNMNSLWGSTPHWYTLSINYWLHLFNHVWVFVQVYAVSYIRRWEDNLWDLLPPFFRGVLWTTLSRPFSHEVILPAPQFTYIFLIFLLELFTHFIVNQCLSFTGRVCLLLFKLLPFDVPSFLYPRCPVSPDLFPLCHGLSFWLFQTFFSHHLPHVGTAQFQLSLLQALLPVFSPWHFFFLFALMVLVQILWFLFMTFNFMTQIYFSNISHSGLSPQAHIYSSHCLLDIIK